jgi:hypothetical protein
MSRDPYAYDEAMMRATEYAAAGLTPADAAARAVAVMDYMGESITDEERDTIAAAIAAVEVTR